MFDAEVILIAGLALSAIALAAALIVRDVRSRKMDAHAMKIMQDE